MQSRAISGAIVVALVVAAVVAFVVLSDDDGDDGGTAATTTPAAEDKPAQKDNRTRPKPEVTTIVVRNGKPAGGVQELEYARGETVRFDVESDVAEHVHVHGYDIFKDVAPGKAASISFPAEIEGGFEVELEDSATQIAELTVEPN